MNNSDLYGKSMMMDMPTGAGFCYRRQNGGKFKWSSMLNKTKFSYESIEWLEYLQKTDNVDVKIQHAMNGGEIRFQNDDFVFYPDGYRKIGSIDHFYFYDGCAYHECERSCSVYNNTHHVQKRDDKKRNRIVKSMGVLHKISSCEWMKNRVIFTKHISAFFNRKTLISEQELHNAICNGELFGLVQCDIQSNEETVAKFMRLNFPPIFCHREVTEDLVGDKMKAKLKENKTKFPLAKQLTLGFNASQILITTEQFLFYHKQGMKLFNFGLVIEYQRDRPLKKFVEKVTHHRKLATVNKDESKQQLYKLVANSSYGRMGMNISKQKSVKYIATDKFNPTKHITPLTKYHRNFEGEYNSGYTEIVSAKKSTEDKVPVHMSFFVLANAKLHFLKFIDIMLTYWDVTKVRLLYMDTGKIFNSDHI